jgi:hypothetical protein
VSGIVDAICRTKVKAKTLERVAAALVELDADGRDFEGRVIAIIRALNEEGPDGSQPHLAARSSSGLRHSRGWPNGAS